MYRESYNRRSFLLDATLQYLNASISVDDIVIWFNVQSFKYAISSYDLCV